MKKLMIIMMCILLVGCSSTEQKDVKEETLKDSIEWSEDNKEINSLKKCFISSYPDVSIEEAMNDKEEKWLYGKDDQNEYLRCDFLIEEKKNIVIYYKDTYDNINIAEYYIKNKKQTKEKIKAFEEAYFIKKEEVVQNNNQDNNQTNMQTQTSSQTDSQSTSIVGKFEANFMPPEGDYYNSPDGGWPNMCKIIIKKTSSNSFKFTIYRVFDENGNSCNEKIFNEHEAVFESYDSRSAVFRGQQYTVYFFCDYFNSFNISGFEPAERAGNLYSTGGSDSFGY